uniref:Cytochrome P450 n=1 Tax=Moniliophthora roreri TaxID=221103 RepID=A0A0W0FX74_MONRR
MATDALSNIEPWKAFTAVVGIFVISRIVNYVRGLQAVNNLPGPRPPFQPFNLPGALIPTNSWNTGADVHWARRFSLYKDNETISIVPWLSGKPQIFTSNLDVLRQVASTGPKSCFIKPETASKTLLLFGINLAAANEDVWRRHRRVMGPAFNSKLYHLVWEQTIKTYRDMLQTEPGWTGKSVDAPVIQEITFKFALLVLGICGFGFDFSWGAPPETEQGEMTVQEAIRTVLDANMLLAFAPEWVLRLPFGEMKRSRKAYNQLTRFMQDQVKLRKEEVRSQMKEEYKRDAFSMLVQANESEDGGVKNKLNDEELIGNVFVMLFAGHETSAHTLAATLGFLAYYTEAQDEVFQQIMDVVGWDRDPAFDDYNNLNKVLGAFYEALRLFPAGHVLIRSPLEDTIMEIPNPRGQEGMQRQPVPKGLYVTVDMVGIQYNPRYFPEPEKFIPSRWHQMQNNDSEQFTAFSLGPRGCIGRKFATAEAVCFLTMILREWKVEPLLKAGETREQWKERVLDGKIVLTLGVNDVPLRFVRRERM